MNILEVIKVNIRSVVMKAHDSEYARVRALKFFTGEDAFKKAIRELTYLHVVKNCPSLIKPITFFSTRKK